MCLWEITIILIMSLYDVLTATNQYVEWDGIPLHNRTCSMVPDE